MAILTWFLLENSNKFWTSEEKEEAMALLKEKGEPSRKENDQNGSLDAYYANRLSSFYERVSRETTNVNQRIALCV